MTISYRKLGAADAKQYREVRLESLKLHPDSFGSSYEEQRDLPKLRFERALEERVKEQFLVGAFDGGVLIGICGFVPLLNKREKLPGSGEIIQVYVKAAYGGRKIGVSLVKATLNKAFQREEIELIILRVRRDNASAVRIYRQAGFQTFIPRGTGAAGGLDQTLWMRIRRHEYLTRKKKATKSMTGPLQDIRIIDLTTVVMGPFATQILGDMGADVIKVEAPAGDGLRYANRGRHHDMGNLFLNNNRNKRSLVLDLKQEKGREVLLRLVSQSDVLVSNMRLQAMARLGLAYADVSAVNRALIYVACVGFGQNGPYADRAAYDDLIQAMVGIPNLFERAYGDEPKFFPVNFCDRVTGLTVVNAISAALFYRERSGEGQSIEIPMFETMLQFLMSDHLGGYTFEPPDGPMGYTRIVNPNRRPYRTKDGYIALLVYNDKQWTEFLQLIDRPELIGRGIFANLTTRGQNIVEVYGFVRDCMSRRTTSEWLALLEESDLPYAAVPRLEDLCADEHLQAINFFQEQEHPSEGRIRTTAIPSCWSESQPTLRRAAPRLGENSLEILREFGYADEEIGTLIDAGVTIEGRRM